MKNLIAFVAVTLSFAAQASPYRAAPGTSANYIACTLASYGYVKDGKFLDKDRHLPVACQTNPHRPNRCSTDSRMEFTRMPGTLRWAITYSPFDYRRVKTNGAIYYSSAEKALSIEIPNVSSALDDLTILTGKGELSETQPLAIVLPAAASERAFGVSIRQDQLYCCQFYADAPNEDELCY